MVSINEDKLDMEDQDIGGLGIRKVNISAKKNHALFTLTNAVSSDTSRNFSDVTLVFSDGVVDYYRYLMNNNCLCVAMNSRQKCSFNNGKYWQFSFENSSIFSLLIMQFCPRRQRRPVVLC